MPGTRATCASIASSTTSCIGRSPRRMRAATSWRPLRHVVICTTRLMPTRIGNQPPCGIFGTLAARNALSTMKNGMQDQQRLPRRPSPLVADESVEDQRRDQHRRRDGDAVRRRQVARRAERDHEADAAEHQQPVDERDVDLADVPLGRVQDRQARQVVELHRLHGEREGARDQRLRGDHGRHRRQDRQRRDRPVGSHLVERDAVADLVAVPLGDQRRLAEVVEHETGQHERVPGDRDRLAPEVPHVGVQRLATGHDEEDRAEGDEALPRFGDEEVDGVLRIDRLEHLRMTCDLVHAERRRSRRTTTPSPG